MSSIWQLVSANRWLISRPKSLNRFPTFDAEIRHAVIVHQHRDEDSRERDRNCQQLSIRHIEIVVALSRNSQFSLFLAGAIFEASDALIHPRHYREDTVELGVGFEAHAVELGVALEAIGFHFGAEDRDPVVDVAVGVVKSIPYVDAEVRHAVIVH